MLNNFSLLIIITILLSAKSIAGDTKFSSYGRDTPGDYLLEPSRAVVASKNTTRPIKWQRTTPGDASGSATISGRVDNLGTAETSRLPVYLYRYYPADRVASSVSSESTNARGFYEFTALPAGTYLVMIRENLRTPSTLATPFSAGEAPGEQAEANQPAYLWMVWSTSGGTICASRWQCRISADNHIDVLFDGHSSNNFLLP